MSVWKETLAEEGQRIKEKKQIIIGANDMNYLGRARNPHFLTNLNGTHSLTFEMPDKYFDSEKGEYVHNDFVDAIFSECKIKFYYKKKWYEFYVKNVSEAKHYKSFMRTYTCSDSYIDELARNGYGITFDESLYNNVDEIGVFSEEILEDSVWEYDPHLNWGDFTEYLEEKLFKIPLSIFGGSINAHKIDFKLKNNYEILNIYTGNKRAAEMGDDLAREQGEFWDSYNNSNSLLANKVQLKAEDCEYLYVPYSQLNFCYVSSDQKSDNGLEEAFAATEYPASYEDKGYALAPASIDPNSFIQFLYIPKNEKIEIDEAGLIINKNYTYVMTIKEWNEQIQSSWFYKFENYKEDGFKKKVLVNHWTNNDYIYGNKATYYEGYLDEIKDLQALNITGKKIAISDRTEINISDEIDQYVKVYNNKATEYKDLYTSEDWIFDPAKDKEYRVCSKIETRQIVPQLARNLLQNSTNINSTTGWEIMESYLTSSKSSAAQLKFYCYESSKMVDIPDEGYSIDVKQVDSSCLIFLPAYEEIISVKQKEVEKLLNSFTTPDPHAFLHESTPLYQENGFIEFFLYDITVNSAWNALSQEEKNKIYNLKDEINSKVTEFYNLYKTGTKYISSFNEKNAIVNFGMIGQEKIIEKGKTYALGINIRALTKKTAEDIGYEGQITENLYNSVFLRIGSGQLIKDGDYVFSDYFDIPIERFLKEGIYKSYILFRPNKTYSNPYFAIYSKVPYELEEIKIFEAYTKGQDQFIDGFFRYSGRDLFTIYTNLIDDGYNYSTPYNELDLRHFIIFEDSIMPGDIYSQTKYFIQQLKLADGTAFDTFGAKKYLDENAEIDASSLPLNAGQYTEDDFSIITNYIDLNECQYYNPAAAAKTFDCKCGSDNFDKVCLYQKYGYCPYRFQTEKHCRRIRTLKGEKSNRFNLTQELGKVFKVYPMYWISHSENGKVLSQAEAAKGGARDITPGRESWMDKRLFYITEKGKENQLGFRYEKNLSNISRVINSDKIVSKLYVLDVDSNISPTGLSSIKTAESNPSKSSFIIDFSYYIAQGLLDKDSVNADLYGINDSDFGYLKTLGYFNTQYDNLSNQIINLTAASFTELKANLDVNLTGIEAAQKRMRQLEKIMSGYTVKNGNSYIENSTYKSYQIEYIEQNAIYVQLIEDTFYTNGTCIYGIGVQPANFFNDDKECQSIEDVKKKWLDTHNYDFGILGQYNKEYNQIKEWTKEQSSYLKRINDLTQKFYRKYEPFLKEGTWSDGNYIDDNAYYYGALEVSKQGAIPKTSYSITPLDIEPLYEEGDYDFEIADTTYVEDIGMFGVNPKTGLPNRLKVLISSLEECPDNLKENKINVQNFTTQFEDLFQQVTASVQSLTFNENIYKRSSNFTSLQTIEKDSLQGALTENELTLLQTPEKNIEIDSTGQTGSDINNHNNKYKLNGQGLFFSNNGGQSWNTSVGPQGINADLIRTGTLDASKIKIVDGDYLYFSWDKIGITAYRDPKLVSEANSFMDYARFNKYGLSLVEKGRIKLRAGYQFNGENGLAENEYDIKGSTPIGFYLYNSSGKEIFSTETGNTAKETARLNLTGEMKIVDNTKISTYIGYKYGGTKYTRQAINCYNIGDDENVLSSIQAEIENNEATYIMSPDSILTENECAAAIAYYYRSLNLNAIIIINNEESTRYDNPTITQKAINMWGRILHDTETRYCQFDYYDVSYSNQGTQPFIILKSDKYKPTGLLGVFETKFILNATIGTDISDTRLNPISISGISDIPSYDLYEYYQPLDVNTCYLLNNAYYTQLLPDEQTTSDGTIALYLNNREDLNEESSSDKTKSRLFVCCGFENDSTRNILTVLKNGDLYIGGTITTINGATIPNDSSMPDKISVKDAYMSFRGDRLFMSFDKIVDSRSELSIENYVMQQLGQSIGQIESSLTGRQHDHYINSYSVDWLNEARIGNVDLSQAVITVHYDGQDYDFTIYDLLGALNLRWGGKYTNWSSI